MKRTILAIVTILLLAAIAFFMTWLFFFYPLKNIGVNYTPRNVLQKSSFSCAGTLTSTVNGSDDFAFAEISKDQGVIAEVRREDRYMHIEVRDNTGKLLWRNNDLFIEDENGKMVVKGGTSIYDNYVFLLNKNTGVAVLSVSSHPLRDEIDVITKTIYFVCG